MQDFTCKTLQYFESQNINDGHGIFFLEIQPPTFQGRQNHISEYRHEIDFLFYFHILLPNGSKTIPQILQIYFRMVNFRT